MATVAGSVVVRVTSGNPPPPPPPVGTPRVVANVNPLVIGPGASYTLTLRIDDGNGNLSVPVGILVPFWPGTNNGVTATPLAVDSLKISVPLGCPAGDLNLSFEVR